MHIIYIYIYIYIKYVKRITFHEINDNSIKSILYIARYVTTEREIGAIDEIQNIKKYLQNKQYRTEIYILLHNNFLIFI